MGLEALEDRLVLWEPGGHLRTGGRAFGGPRGPLRACGDLWGPEGGPLGVRGRQLGAWGTFGDRVMAFGTPVVFWELDGSLRTRGGPLGVWAALEGRVALWEPGGPLGFG